MNVSIHFVVNININEVTNLKIWENLSEYNNNNNNYVNLIKLSEPNKLNNINIELKLK